MNQTTKETRRRSYDAVLPKRAARCRLLKEIGILTTVGRRKATRSDATEAVWARAEPSGPTGQTAAAYADNPTEAEQMTLGSAT